MSRTYGKAQDLIDFTRASSGTALRRVKYGDELVTNGTFDTDSDWLKGTGWTISGGTASYDGTGGTSPIRQQPTENFKVGSIYQLSLDVISNEGTGDNTIYITASQSINNDHLLLGSHKFTFIPTSADVSIFIYGRSGESFSIDNVSLKEVLFDQPNAPLTLFNHPVNIPRVEYDADGNRLGLLVEEQRTNLFTYSEDFTDSSWESVGTIIPNSATAPNGENNASLLSVNYLEIRPSVTSGTKYTYSIFVKGLTNFTPEIVASGTSFPSTRARFDLTNGTVTFVDAEDATIQDYGNGWFRVSITETATATDSTSRIRFYCEQAYIWGAQLEAGSFPTSYIPTSGSTATRSADVASLSTSAFGYRQDEGTVVVDASSNGVSALIAYLSDSTANERIFLYINDGYQGYITDGGSVQAQIDGGTTQSGYNKIGLGYKTNDTSLSLNGGNAVTDTACSMPLITKMNIGSDFNNAVAATRHIKSIKYYPRRLTNAQLQELTA